MLATAVMAEWLRRWTRNPMGSPRAGSNPAYDEVFYKTFFYFTYSVQENYCTFLCYLTASCTI